MPPIPINYTRPQVYDYQRAILDCPARYTFTIAATKVGKTASHIIWLFEEALKRKANESVWWVAPTFSQAKIAYNRLKVQITDKDGKQFFKANETNLIITLRTGAKIEFKTAEKPDNLYGDDVYAAVFDEFTRAREAAWHALRSTITSTGGKIKFIGNAKSKKNWGVKLAMRAKAGLEKDMQYFKITAYDAAAAGMMTKDGRPFLEEIESAKNDLPENVFSELYLAEPTDDGANPFGLKYIAACTTPELSKHPSICYGIDLARKVDWTTQIGLDKFGWMSYYKTMTGTSWKFITESIKGAPAARSTATAIDSTGVGDPIGEDLGAYLTNLELFVFTGNSRQQLLEGLALAIQQRKIIIVDDEKPSGLGRIRHQLEQFEYQYTRSGGVKWSAPEGDADDDVMALALAWHKWKTASLSNGEISIW